MRRQLKFKNWFKYALVPLLDLPFILFAASELTATQVKLSSNLLFSVAAAVIFISISIAVLSERVTIGDDYIERKRLFSVLKVFYRQITRVQVAAWAFTFEGRSGAIRIGAERKGWREFSLALIEKLGKERDLEIEGDLSAATKFGLRKSSVDYLDGAEKGRRPGAASKVRIELVEKQRLIRSFIVVDGDLQFGLAYNGRGRGYEAIFLDGRIAAIERGFWWYVPRFEFEFEGRRYEIFVRVSPWISISEFRIEVDGIEAYREG